MTNFLSSKKVLWIFVAIGVLAVLVALIAALGVSNRSSVSTDTQKNLPAPPEVKKEAVDNSKLPAKFPADMPIEANAKIIQNFTGTTPDGKFLQATRKFETAKTLDENYKIYQNYFQKSGWTITTTSNLAASKSITATKGTLQANVTLSENSVTKQRTVDITVTELNK